jgi:hypothetical protein
MRRKQHTDDTKKGSMQDESDRAYIKLDVRALRDVTVVRRSIGWKSVVVKMVKWPCAQVPNHLHIPLFRKIHTIILEREVGLQTI